MEKSISEMQIVSQASPSQISHSYEEGVNLLKKQAMNLTRKLSGGSWRVQKELHIEVTSKKPATGFGKVT